MEKQNVVEPKRTPDAEIKSAEADWDVDVAGEFKPVVKSEAKPAKKDK